MSMNNGFLNRDLNSFSMQSQEPVLEERLWLVYLLIPIII